MGHAFDSLSRGLAHARSRREALQMVLSAVFGGSLASACINSSSPSSTCSSGFCMGTDGKCYGNCSSGNHCTSTPSPLATCSNSVAGVYCCSDSATNTNGGGGNSGGNGGGGNPCICGPGWTYNFGTNWCCPNAYPYFYPGTHGITEVGCYSSCPYIGDCGTTYQRC